MSQCSSVLVALLLLTSSAALAKDNPAPKPDVFKGMPEDLQLIGWSKDEEEFVVRKYLPPTDPDNAHDCEGYMDHRGKKFVGGLSIVLYVGSVESESWEIQDPEKCTPPAKARKKLAAAKAALAKRKIDLSVIGTVMVPEFEYPDSCSEDSKDSKDCERCYSSTAQLKLPSGPWKGETLVVEQATKEKGCATGEDDMGATKQAAATFTVSLRDGEELTQLDEYSRSNDWVSAMGHWELTFKSIVLSPSGKRFVAIGHLSEGDMRRDSDNSFIFGFVELPAPKSKAAR